MVLIILPTFRVGALLPPVLAEKAIPLLLIAPALTRFVVIWKERVVIPGASKIFVCIICSEDEIRY